MNANLELIKEAYANFAKGNIPAILDILSDNIVWELPSSAGTTFSGIFKGKKGVLDFFQHVADENDFREFIAQAFIAEGDNVIVLGYGDSASRRTGKTAKNRWAHCWTMENGKAVAHYEYVDTAAIRDAFKN